MTEIYGHPDMINVCKGLNYLLGPEAIAELKDVMWAMRSRVGSRVDLFMEFYRLVGESAAHLDVVATALWEEAHRTNRALYLPPRLAPHLNPVGEAAQALSEAAQALGEQLAGDLSVAPGLGGGGDEGPSASASGPEGGGSNSATYWGALG